MTTKAIDGFKDKLDVKAIFEAFEMFKDKIYDAFNDCEEAVVDLAFDTSLDKDHHFSFAQDELINLKDIKINPVTNQLMFLAFYGAKEKPFYMNDAELISLSFDWGGALEKTSLDNIVRDAFAPCFKALKINSIAALQAMCKNNPGLIKVLNDEEFLDKLDKVEKATATYGALEKFGLY